MSVNEARIQTIEKLLFEGNNDAVLQQVVMIINLQQEQIETLKQQVSDLQRSRRY